MTRQEKTWAPLLGYVGCRVQSLVFSGDIEEFLKQIGVSIWESRDSGLHSSILGSISGRSVLEFANMGSACATKRGS